LLHKDLFSSPLLCSPRSLPLFRQVEVESEEGRLFSLILRGFRDSGIQGFRDSGIQGFRDSGIQGFRDSGIQGFRDSGIQGFRDSEIQGFRDSGIQRFRDSGIGRVFRDHILKYIRIKSRSS
jgi:hypothetical protein